MRQMLWLGAQRTPCHFEDHLALIRFVGGGLSRECGRVTRCTPVSQGSPAGLVTIGRHCHVESGAA